MNVHSNTFYNSHKVEVPVSRCIDKQNMVYPYRGILLGTGGTLTGDRMYEP